MTKSISLRQRVYTALSGGKPDQIPFTIYESKFPQCAAERELRTRGMCIVRRNIPVFCTRYPNVRFSKYTYYDNGKTFTRAEYKTPYGDFHCIQEDVGFTAWTHKRLFTCPEDYKRLLFLINGMTFSPNYAAFKAAEDADGGDSFFRGAIGREPMQEIILGYMGIETFCMEWYERQDEILKLYEALAAKHRQIYPLCAESPALAFNYGGNIMAELLGRERFEKYYVPHYEEAADVLHKKGKLIGVHFDGNCKTIADIIVATSLDYIEAFTPSPDTDMTLEEARDAWPDKVLWINFPSSVHLESHEIIMQTTRDLIRQARYPERFIMGITEDIPEDRWQGNLLAIQSGVLE